ncbi:MAG: pseudouridine synthase [Lachnospiraceae bacterium]|nr:pseudouridine synthase [Lachnospiraceae bacterium]
MIDKVRINKYLSAAGVCSRREADRLIEAGKITVNGQTAVTGMTVSDEDDIFVNGKPVQKEDKPVLLAYNKPRGVVCTSAKDEPDNIIDRIHYPVRIYPVGRLDKDSEGLILLTNQGDLMDKLLRSRNLHEKEYIVTVNRPVSAEFVKKMSEGVPILDTVTRPCRVKKLSSCEFSIILTQGLNRQIRRMCEALDYRVRKLVRVRVANITLGELPSGQYREIRGAELDSLLAEVRNDRKFSN